MIYTEPGDNECDCGYTQNLCDYPECVEEEIDDEEPDGYECTSCNHIQDIFAPGHCIGCYGPLIEYYS